jgi:hypothetical protein
MTSIGFSIACHSFAAFSFSLRMPFSDYAAEKAKDAWASLMK